MRTSTSGPDVWATPITTHAARHAIQERLIAPAAVPAGSGARGSAAMTI